MGIKTSLHLSVLSAAIFASVLCLASCNHRGRGAQAKSSSLLQSVAQVPRADTCLTLKEWKAGSAVDSVIIAEAGVESCFSFDTIPDNVFARMKGRSYPEGCPVRRSDLCYVRALHYDNDGNIRLGEMVCNKKIAADLVDVLRELFDKRYPIERMVLIDEYDAIDEKSMQDNNSSAFCYRAVAGSRFLSKHAYGMAVDINTLYNPYVRPRQDGSLFIQPSTAGDYVDRSRDFPYKISPSDAAVEAFRKRGFSWGGAWPYPKDYQHFERNY